MTFVASGIWNVLDGAPVAANLFTTYPACAGLSYAKILVTPGTHRLSSSVGFVAYAYGLASGESYMYGLSNDMQVVVPQDSVICSSGPITLTSPIVLANAQWTMASDPSTVLATNITWANPLFGPCEVSGERLARTATVQVLAYQEAGEL